MAARAMERFSSKAALHARIMAYERETKSSFVLMTKDKCFGAADWRNVGSKNNLFWQIPSVPLDGIPFLSLGRKVLGCHFGRPKNKAKLDQVNGADTLKAGHTFQKSKKMGCPAQMQIRHIIKFPEFKVEMNSSAYKKRVMMQKLRKSLILNPELKAETAYYVEMPDPADHNGHPIDGVAAGMLEKPDPLVQAEILNLARFGVQKVSDVKKHLSEFVTKVFEEEEVRDTSRRRFHPLDKDIRNIIQKAKTFKGHTEDYQETLRCLVEETQNRDPKPAIPQHAQDGNEKDDAIIREKPILIRYQSKQPDFLKQQPREVVSHILRRMKSNVTKEDMLMIGDGVFTVRSEIAGEAYKVSFGSEIIPPYCTCPDFHKYKLPCKHFCAIFEYYPEWNWYRLPATYRDNLLFVSDPKDCFEVEVTNEPDVVRDIGPEMRVKVLDDDVALSESSTDSEDKIYVKMPRKKQTTRQGLRHKCVKVLRQIIDSVHQLRDADYLQGLHHDLQCKLIEVQLQTPSTAEFHVCSSEKRKAESDGENSLVKKRTTMPDEEMVILPKVEIRTVDSIE